MMENVNFENARTIVEYGPGTGVFTEKLLEKRNSKTIIFLVENNMDFYLLLKEKFEKEKNLFIVCGSAENIDEYLKDYRIPYADYVISGLPFASLPKNVSIKILFNTTKILNKNGQFITFQYTKLKMTFIEQFFAKIDVTREYRNFPPAFVFCCTMPNQNEEGYYGVKNSYCR